MISIMSLPAGEHRDVYWTSYGVNNCVGAVFRNLKTDRFKTGRLGGEYLWQGGAFDKFGNKQVSNVQILGHLAARQTTNGSDVATPIPVSGNAVRILSLPPAIKLSNQYRYNLDAGDILVAVDSSHGNRWKTTVTHVTKIGYGDQVVVLWSTVTVDFYAPTGRLWAINAQASSGRPRFSESYGPVTALGDKVYKTADERLDYALRQAPVYQAIVEGVVRAQCRAYISANPSWTTSWTRIRSLTISEPQYDLAKLPEWVKLLEFCSSGVSFSTEELSNHAGDVIESVNDFSSNMLAYVSDLGKTGDTIREILKLGRNIKSPKAWASAWLSGRYGDRLMISDTRELLESLQRKLKTRAEYAIGRKTMTKSQTFGESVPVSVEVSRTSTAIVANDSYSGLMTAVGNLMRWDAWPTLENTWDMIPLSFVVDWVLPVQDILGQIDVAVEAPYLKPLSQYYGEKRLATVSLPAASGLMGQLIRKQYNRRAYPVIADVRPFTAELSLPSFSVVHAVDALALVATVRR